MLEIEIKPFSAKQKSWDHLIWAGQYESHSLVLPKQNAVMADGIPNIFLIYQLVYKYFLKN